jgi:hypothetical protein
VIVDTDKKSNVDSNQNGLMRFYSFTVRIFLLLILIRGVILVFNEHDIVSMYLGHKSENDAWRHITMVLLFWSLYSALVANCCYNANSSLSFDFAWLEPFQVRFITFCPISLARSQSSPLFVAVW